MPCRAVNRGPDFFVVLNTERKERQSWVVWAEEGKYPNIIIEVLSASTAAIDKGIKKEIYQDTFRTLEYFLYDPFSLELIGYTLVQGKYEIIRANGQGYLESRELGLYLGVVGKVLRFLKADGELVETPAEANRQAELKATQALE